MIAAVCMASGSARAALGGHASTINDELTQARGQLRTLKQPDHMRYEMTLPNGGTVHEFANASGVIFAVSWSGPGKPDLRALLGNHFTHLQQPMVAPRGGRMFRQPVQVNRADIQIQTGGHMGYFWGVAYLPALAPAGFSTESLK